MARYGSEHKQATRARILETSGRRFKRAGIDGSGIAGLMADAGLTNGAFYAHFAGKDDLVAEVVARELATQCDAMDAIPATREAMEAFVRFYLSAEHRDSPADGCPNAALLDEIGRLDERVRDAYARGITAILDVIARHLDPADPEAARDRAQAVFTLMIGTLQLARAVTPPKLSDEVLSRGVLAALAYLPG